MDDWVRALRPGGLLKIAVPDFGKIAENYVAGVPQQTEGYVLGGQVDDYDFHQSLFDEAHLKKIMATAGLVLLRPWKSELADDCAALPISLNISGVKPCAAQPKVRGVMTVPRLGFNDMWSSAITALPQLGVDFTSVSGAFWDQSLTLAMERVLDEQADYLLVMDYDSVFTKWHVAQLLQLAMVNPNADAIAPLQASRHFSNPLFGMDDESFNVSKGSTTVDVERAALEVDLIKVPQAHFGLTLVRADKLRALPRPWFIGTPNSDGEWKTGKVDADIHFWRKWKAAGNSLFLAPRVVIGHLELMVRWPGVNMEPLWQRASDWEADKKPPANTWTGFESCE